MKNFAGRQTAFVPDVRLYTRYAILVWGMFR